MSHKFSEKWITDGVFSELEPRNVFHRQLEPIDLPPTTISYISTVAS